MWEREKGNAIIYPILYYYSTIFAIPVAPNGTPGFPAHPPRFGDFGIWEGFGAFLSTLGSLRDSRKGHGDNPCYRYEW